LPRSSAVCPSSPAPNYKPMECGSGESVSKPTNGAGPRPLLMPCAWCPRTLPQAGMGAGLRPYRAFAFWQFERRRRGLIPAWGNAP
jgi:hypothetical protein